MIGCGGYAAFIIDNLEKLPNLCELVAATTLDPDDPAAEACRQKGIAVHNSVGELLENISPESVSAVVIPTSIDSHFEYARTMVGRGFHVLLEKPPVSTVQDLDRLIDLQRKSKRFISVNFQNLHTPIAQDLKARLATGTFGAIRKASAHACVLRPETYFARSHWSGLLRLDGKWVLDGTAGNPLAHLLAESLYLATPKSGMAVPATVQAELYHANAIESEDTSCIRIETTEGIPLFFTATLCSEDINPVICEIETERATIRIADYVRVEIVWNDGREEQYELPGSADPHHPMHLMLESIIEKLKNNKRPLITVEECRPYMLAWNGAFDSFGEPAAIGEESSRRIETEYGTVRCIPGIQAVAEQACAEHRLFSELGAPWANPGTKLDLSGYRHFPSANPALIDMAEKIPASGSIIQIDDRQSGL